MSKRKKLSNSGNAVTGLIFIIIGTILLLKFSGIYFPRWIFRWEMVLIIIGIVIGVKSRFQNTAWFVLTIIGSVSLLDNIFPMFYNTKVTWGVIFVLIGLYIVLKPQFNSAIGYDTVNKDDADDYTDINATKETYTDTYTDPLTEANDFSNTQAFSNTQTNTNTMESERINVSAVFGGINRKIYSKNFLGGKVTAALGGAEIDLSQADINGPVILELNAIMGGVDLKIPAHWNVKSEMTAVFGGVEDKRHINPNQIQPNKTLIIRGVALFGGVDIKSYSY